MGLLNTKINTKMFFKAKVPSVSGQDGHCSKDEVLWVYSDKPFWQAHACTEECLC